jgi:hypothetical protein
LHETSAAGPDKPPDGFGHAVFERIGGQAVIVSRGELYL